MSLISCVSLLDSFDIRLLTTIQPYNPVFIPVTTTLLPRPFTTNRICDKEAFACDIATVRPQQKATRLPLGLPILLSHELVIRELSPISIDTGFFRRLHSGFWLSPKYSNILFSNPPSPFRRASQTSSKWPSSCVLCTSSSLVLSTPRLTPPFILGCTNANATTASSPKPSISLSPVLLLPASILQDVPSPRNPPMLLLRRVRAPKPSRDSPVSSRPRTT